MIYDQESIDELTRIAGATEFAYVDVDCIHEIIQDGLVESNPSLTNEQGENACRITEKGRVVLAESLSVGKPVDEPAAPWAGAPVAQPETEPDTTTTPAVEQPAPAPVDGDFGFDSNVPIPERKAVRSARKPKYPFAQLTQHGQSFHVAATEGNPKPANRLSSAANTYLKILEREGCEADKLPKFKVCSVGADDPRGAGARVFRIISD